jgi:peroxiredoxin
MKKFLVISVTALLLISCNSSDKFKLSGKITSADGKMIYLEHTGLLSTETIDSTKVKSDGSFHFKAPRPEYPDFYRLKIDGKTIAFAVDSCEAIQIEAPLDKFSTDYTITGSESNTDIQLLRKSLLKIQTKVNAITVDMNSDERAKRLAEIDSDVKVHKEIAKKIILKNTRSTAAYFAVYQKINNTFLFNPYVKEDKPFFAAVATAYNTFMPDYERTKNLYSLTLDAINTERQNKAKQAWSDVMDKVATGYIDIELPDKTGKMKKLSDLEGKVVLIDFSAYEMDQSVQYTFELRELYNKYHSRGFEIYQVSLDRNKILWENSVENIPWVCVRDENGQNTVSVGNYNVKSVPTTFLLSKKGIIVGRSFDFETLDKEIAKSL